VDPGLKRLPARLYRSNSGREPVREWLRKLDAGDRKILGEDIKDVEFSWPIGMPLVRALGRELWEVRSNLPRGRIARILFCVEAECMVLLHGFIKKTQKTPQPDLDLALRRKKGEGA
jgi:phage-related protein